MLEKWALKNSQGKTTHEYGEETAQTDEVKWPICDHSFEGKGHASGCAIHGANSLSASAEIQISDYSSTEYVICANKHYYS